MLGVSYKGLVVGCVFFSLLIQFIFKIGVDFNFLVRKAGFERRTSRIFGIRRRSS